MPTGQPILGYRQPLLITTGDGPALTAAAAASCLPAAAHFTLQPNYWAVGKAWHVFVMGRISCVVTTPGTARFDLRMGPAASPIVVFDTGALNLNVVAKTNVPFWLEVWLTCRSIGAGTAATLMGLGIFQSEAVVGSPANTAGGNGSLSAPVGAPAVGNGFDSTIANYFDSDFTQTVATGSMTVHQFIVEEVAPLPNRWLPAGELLQTP